MNTKEIEGPTLIRLDPDGKPYTNQAGGYACLHPEEVGQIVVPPPAYPGAKRGRTKAYMQALDDVLYAYFAGPLSKHGGHCYPSRHAPHFGEADARFVEAVFQTLFHCVEVDRSMFHASMEAWVYATWGGKPAILAWTNSD